MAATDRCAIETRALRKVYGATVAVADLSLRVNAGEIFGLLGPNGGGKSTAIKLLLGLVEPTSGTGQVLGAPLGDRAVRARVGVVPEHFRFQDTLTAAELLRVHGRLHGLGGAALDARIDRLLTRVDLRAAADRALGGYSQGMVQRVALAQALLNEPELVFLDEPTAGLDPQARGLVRGVIDDLRAAGVTVFLNSHQLGDVEATCDRVAFVKRGRVIDLRRLSTPAEAFDVELRVAFPRRVAPSEPDRAAILEGLSRFGTHIVQPRPDLIALRTGSDEAIPAIVCWLAHQRVQIHAVQPRRRRSLQDVFLDVMAEDERPAGSGDAHGHSLLEGRR